ncbi:MAG TPA: efflux RND transporter periplasmic adaptor subunit [Vicinamibacterales bacterium]|nr:efflux RND transporter periplasmic adaptor subunit [Vicinamibacterales bacterium]
MNKFSLRATCRWLAVAGAIVSLTGCAKTTETAQARGRDDAAKAVKTETVREESVRRNVEIVGTLAAVDEVTVSSEADGVVAKILHDLGDRVKAGDALVELDREKAEYNLEQQKAALQRALAQYGAPDAQHLPAVEKTPDVQKAQADLVQAKQSFDRASELFKRQLVPKQTLDDAQAMLQSKQAGYDLSLQNAKNLQANIAAADAGAKLADRQLRDTYIRAPFDGFVQRRFVNLGQLVKGSGTPVPVMSVVRIDPLKVTGEIPEKMVPWMSVGQGVEVHVDAYPDKAIAGKISRISPSVNPATRAFPFEALVANGDALLKPGTFGRVRIETNKIDKVLTLSYSSLQYRYGVNRVFVINGDKLSAKELKVGERLGDRIEVVSGVNAGDMVATTDVDKLVDGVRVTTAGAAKKTE